MQACHHVTTIYTLAREAGGQIQEMHTSSHAHVRGGLGRGDRGDLVTREAK